MKTRATKEQAKEREEFIVGVLRDAHGNPVMADDLYEAVGGDIEYKSFATLMRKLAILHSEICHMRGNRSTKGYYYWRTKPETIATVTEPKVEESEPRYGDSKNDEGYPDPTMAAVLFKNGEFGREMPAGEIWSCKRQKDSFESIDVLVLAKYNTTVTCIPFHRDPGILYDAERVQCRSISFKGKMAMVNIARVCSKPVKWFEQKVGQLDPEELSKVRAYIGEYLGVAGVGVKVIEVPVVKVEEKPVEVKPVGYTQEQVDAMIEAAREAERIATYKEIAEKAAFKMLKQLMEP